MNKAELIEALAEASGLSKTQSSTALDTTLGLITNALRKGGKVSLVGFGSFEVRKRGARIGRNPRTGETIKIKASRLPVFRAGKTLKEAV